MILPEFRDHAPGAGALGESVRSTERAVCEHGRHLRSIPRDEQADRVQIGQSLSGPG